MDQCSGEDAWLAAILAYSPGWQGIFFLAVKTTSYCGDEGTNINIWWLKRVNNDSYYWQSSDIRAKQKNLLFSSA
jgi:hypothetical protein